MLIFLGIVVGFLSGLLGVGGGIMVVPALVALNYTPLNAVAISAVAIALTAFSGSFYNWRTSTFNLKELAIMSVPCVLGAPLGVLVAMYLEASILLLLFGILLVGALVLFMLSPLHNPDAKDAHVQTYFLLLIGGIAGFLSGIFGVGGGIILVPLQVLALKLDVRVAIKNSLAIVLVASICSVIAHTLAGNSMFKQGLLIGFGGIFGAQMGSYLLPRLSEKFTRGLFAALLFFLAFSMFWRAYIFI